MSDLTFIIPIGLNHQDVAQRAIDSVEAQTIPCQVITRVDTARRGPGALRNEMLRQVTTEFVSFLDADDWIESTFAEETIAAYMRAGGNTYIFTDWIDGAGRVIEAPCMNAMDGHVLSTPDRKPYCGGTWHPLTTLLPTAWARAVNGFDEQLPAVEDTDMWLKMCTTFRCGTRLARPLFHYTPGGKRSHDFATGPDYDRVMGELTQRYGGKMGCCGDATAIAKPIGEKQSGDVLAMALWHGNRSEFGRVSKRHYPRLSFPRTAWVDPSDVSYSPNLWQMIEQIAVDERVGIQSVAELAQMGMNGVRRNPYAPPTIEPDPPPVHDVKRDVQRIVNMARNATRITGDPIFVFPEKHYPSYSDIRRLAELSGFDIISPKKIDPFGRRPYIVVSPEPPGQLNGLRAHIICWQLEYAGDYTHNYDGLNVDVWASDKVWAAEHGAKYVMLGSHPGLADGEPLDPHYDVSMLAYLTPRRQMVKDVLSDLRWPVDYPGHDMSERDTVLLRTKLMLHIHQHENAPYMAPQRIAIAAAHYMPVVSETVKDAGDLESYLTFADYADIPDVVRKRVAEVPVIGDLAGGEQLNKFLCVEHTFRSCVKEALKT